MATTTQIAAPVRAHSILALWHLLSLDAPAVAALWTWFIARSAYIAIPAAVPLAMAIAVWILYAADRLLDARHINSPREFDTELEPRHLFHHRHRRAFFTGILLATAALAALLPSLEGRAIHLYVAEGALLVVWYLILHASPSAHRLPKEIAVGLFFSAAVFIPTIARQPALRLALLPAASLLAALCSLNCLFIYAWEHEDSYSKSRPAHPTTRIALAHLPHLGMAICAAGAALVLHSTSQALIPSACAAAALLLLLLHKNHRLLSRTDLRAAADVALLTPLLLLPFLR